MVSMAKDGPFMLAFLSKGMSSVMKAPPSLMPFARFTIRGVPLVWFLILSEKGTMTEEGSTSITTSAFSKTLSSPVAVMPGFRNFVGKYLVFWWLVLMSSITSSSIVWRTTWLFLFQASLSATEVPNTPAPATTISFILLFLPYYVETGGVVCKGAHAFLVSVS